MDGVTKVEASGAGSHKMRLFGRVQVICMQRPHSLQPTRRHHRFGAVEEESKLITPRRCYEVQTSWRSINRILLF
jgi:hypothetical protein